MTDTTTTMDAPPQTAMHASWVPHLLIIALVWTAWAVLMEHGDRSTNLLRTE